MCGVGSQVSPGEIVTNAPGPIQVWGRQRVSQTQKGQS